MTGSASTYLQAARLSWFKGTAHPASPADTYVALYTTMPTQAGTGGVEVSGTGYARVAIAQAGWGAITGTGPWQIATNAATNFGNAGSAWGTVLGFGIYDALAGNLLYIDTFATPVVISNGQPVAFASGVITITESGAQSAYLADARLSWYKGTTYPAAPADVYVALYTTMPTPANTGGVEVSGTGYARQAIAAAGGWSALTGTDPTEITNAAIVNYGSAGSAWGTVLGFGFLDALTAGDLLDLVTLGSSQAVNSGAAVTFAIGACGISAD